MTGLQKSLSPPPKHHSAYGVGTSAKGREELGEQNL